MFAFKEDSGNRMAYDLVHEIPFRVRAIMRHFPNEVAEMAFKEILAKAPKGIEGYPESLEIQQFSIPGTIASSGIVANSKANSYKIKAGDPGKSIIYIQAKKVKGEYDAGSTVLSRYNPWTFDELPYEPDPKVCEITIREVTESEIRNTRLRLRSIRKQISGELAEVGIYKRVFDIKSASASERLIGQKVTRDLTFEVLRAEFGVGAKHNPHWRPALRNVITTYAPSVMYGMFRWFAVLSEKRWLRPVKGKVGKSSTVRKVQRFQDIVYSSKGIK